MEKCSILRKKNEKCVEYKVTVQRETERKRSKQAERYAKCYFEYGIWNTAKPLGL
jgi:hypothetical protein